MNFSMNLEKEPRVTVGLYRHFKGKYFYVTGLSKSYDEKTIMVNYFNVCYPELGSYVRPLENFCDFFDKDKSVYICQREDNVTGQYHRFERVKDLNFQLGSISTEQLIEELRSRKDSPIHELDIEGLMSDVFSTDYVVGVSYDNPEFSRGVEVICVTDTKEKAEQYLSTHIHRRGTRVFKRTFIEVE